MIVIETYSESVVIVIVILSYCESVMAARDNESDSNIV